MKNIQYGNNTINKIMFVTICQCYIYDHLHDGYKCPIYKFVNCAGMAACLTLPKWLEQIVFIHHVFPGFV